jgi:hypothetical protein
VDSSLIVPLITGSGVAGVFCVLFVLGLVYPRQVVTDLKAEVAELKAALKEKQDAMSAAVTAASATKDILEAIRLGQNLGQGRKGP